MATAKELARQEAERERARNKTALKAIREAAASQYGGMIPQGDVDVQGIPLSWTQEMVLGNMRRNGILSHWKQEKDGYENGNVRHYAVTIDSSYL